MPQAAFGVPDPVILEAVGVPSSTYYRWRKHYEPEIEDYRKQHVGKVSADTVEELSEYYNTVNLQVMKAMGNIAMEMCESINEEIIKHKADKGGMEQYKAVIPKKDKKGNRDGFMELRPKFNLEKQLKVWEKVVAPFMKTTIVLKEEGDDIESPES